jgi:hypothetical protein
LLLICFSNLKNVIKYERNKFLKFLDYNKVLIIDDCDLEPLWIDFVSNFNFTHKNLHRLSEDPNSNADIIVPSFFLTLPDTNGLHLLRNYNKNRKKSFFCLMNKNRPHRNILIKTLYEKNLLNKGKVVYHKCNIDEIKNFLHQQIQFEDLKNFNESDINWNDNQITKDYLEYNLEIIAETSADYHFITEKTVRPLSTGMPFLVISSQYYLKFLKECGFETYSNFLDESYDNEYDINSRVHKVTNVLLDINEKDLLNLYEKTSLIREHNLEQLFFISNSYNQKYIEKIYHWIKNL